MQNWQKLLTVRICCIYITDTIFASELDSGSIAADVVILLVLKFFSTNMVAYFLHFLPTIPNAYSDFLMNVKNYLMMFLLASSPQIHAEDGKDLFLAAMNGNEERVITLLNQGVDVNSKNAGGRTALMAACFSGNMHSVKTLLAYGADSNIADNAGNTALMDALIFGDEDIINLLIKSGANVNAKDAQQLPLLERAKKISNESVIKLLEAAGAKGNEPPKPPEPTAEELAAKKAAEEAAAAEAEKPKKRR